VDAGITVKVVSVEGENVSDTIHGHRSDEACIVDLLPRHAMRHNEPAPFRIDIVSVGKSKNGTFDASNNSIGLGRGEPEPVVLDRPRGNSPKLDQVLGGNADAVSIFAEPRYRIARLAMLGMGALKPTKDDVGIGEDVHYRFQSSSRA